MKSKTEHVMVYLHDEIPQFGCGVRYLEASYGWKWVHLTDCKGRRKRMKPEAFAALKPVVFERA